MTVTPAQNGTTLHVAVGTVVIAAQFPWPSAPTSSNPAVLAPGISPMAIVCHPPGGACVGPPRTFAARARGTAQIVAQRETCGEAQRCVSPMDWTRFAVTVVVE
ncbi:hypothetical protein KGQ19_31675 [Catenulispora sp. NL8]|uniref:Uncharacterized protein n=1 Tax=Catenulispora pinistramenti TaxID=2705254 RepID=A0ABS5KZC6_9ACTN|nr:hypothetical protein [Catenulispora pinistramenti]MBS2551437.1 hypothetical protein [Catenulispora pinistramenti]